jgi:hypothetical protein
MELHYLLVGFESISKVCRKISTNKEKALFPASLIKKWMLFLIKPSAK